MSPVPSFGLSLAAESVCGLGGLSQGYANMALKHHNIHRNAHAAQYVKWDCNLASKAQVLAQRCYFGHDMNIGGGGYGQNIAGGPTGDEIGVIISDMWYNSEKDNFSPFYNQENPGGSDFNNVFNKIGHFTAVVWNSTTSIGCYTNYCSGGVANGAGTNYITVCNYSPPGNMMGEFANNVFRPRIPGGPTINGAYVPGDEYLAK